MNSWRMVKVRDLPMSLRQLAEEICELRRCSVEDVESWPLRDLLDKLCEWPASAWTLDRVATPQILNLKFGKLSPEDPVHQFVRELLGATPGAAEMWDGKSVLSLLKIERRAFEKRRKGPASKRSKQSFPL